MVATILCEPPPARRRPYGRIGAIDRIRFGRAGEDAAARYLISRGYRIRARRYRVRAGEIDLIAEDAGTLVFGEVKSRRTILCGAPAEAVDGRKRMHLVRAARFYLSREIGRDRLCRFDVVEVLVDSGGSFRISLIRDAFQEG